MAGGAAWAVIGYALSLGGAIASAVVAAWLATRSDPARRERGMVVAALAVTALWCVVNAAWGPGTGPAALLEGARNLLWIAAIYRLFAADGRDQSLVPIRPLVIVLATVECLQPAILMLDLRFGDLPGVHATAFSVGALLHALVAVGSLMLLHNLYAGASAAVRQVLRWPAAALAAFWAFQLNLYTVGWLAGAIPDELVALRGLLAATVALLFAIGGNARAADLRLSPSRTVAFQSLSLVIIGVYLLAMLLFAQSLTSFGGGVARLTQVGFVALAGVLALFWLPSRRLRGLLRVTVLKHLFQHRYDYRSEWLRFTGTIGRAGPDAPSLSERSTQALADITDSPGALLFLPSENGDLDLAGRWQWPAAELTVQSLPPAFAAMLERSGAIVELDAVRTDADASGEQRAVPEKLRDDARAWAVVPLVHFDRLVGAVVLARPVVARRLDWEDFDLLKIAGRQLASYLAEQAGHEALHEAARFDEFNRRIAFVMHDIKNLASQLSLLARNAERHADNPEFRKDMLVTLTKSSDKLNALLARLGRYGASCGVARHPVDLAFVARDIAGRYGDASRVLVTRADSCMVLAEQDGLEQALVHLVQNAVEASADGMPVYLDVSCDGLQGRIDVIDSGTGMTPQFVRDGLFRPFVSSKDGGFGIGAFEARELVRAMGGRLDVTSREGLGTRFTILLPLSAAAGFITPGVRDREVA